ncbi:hypothetical protein CASFOL_035430 [Castilleja foliolosa]|uniref:F-box domain-containing protein n=1 Tax=Castilleja foliolosa TaxID=1961234 RepID=A0ABD3BSK7_9LAMI
MKLEQRSIEHKHCTKGAAGEQAKWRRAATIVDFTGGCDKREFGESDFGGGGDMREEGMNELGKEHEFNEGEEFGGNESNSVGNHGEMVLVSSSNDRIKEMSIDRLETLPDYLLIHILSRLETKEAAKTSVLSKRWQYLWTETPSLSFEKNSTDIEDTRELVTRIYRTLVHRTCSYLDRLYISFTYDKCFASDVNVWVEFSVRSKVKQLWLMLRSRTDFFYMIPQTMYSCCSFTELYLEGCILEPHGTIHWKYLTELRIDGVELHEHVIQKIISSCPVLSSLTLTDCYGFERLDIYSQSLHYLSVDDCEDEHSGVWIEISAPYLRQLFMSHWRGVRLPNIQSLIHAEIQFDLTVDGVTEEEMIDMIYFLEDIKHVKELKLGCRCIEVVSKLAENGWQLPKSTRERLTIETLSYKYIIPAIVVLLESSPRLESLVALCFVDFAPPGSTWDLVGWDDLACDLLHLKTVKLSDYADPNLKGEPLLTIGRILLKRATTLEKMVFDSSENLTESFVAEISQELLSYTRSSEKALVLYHPWPVFTLQQ